jgi:hypothetical protein
MTKKIFFLIAICLALSCKKEEIDPELLKFRVLTNHFIYSREDPAQSAKYTYPFNSGSNKSVVYYNSDPAETGCCDRGAPFVAFEIAAGSNSFTYSDSVSLANAHCINGMTGSIIGPTAFPLRSAKITGKKKSEKEWIITIDIPANNSILFKQLNLHETFQVF